VIHHLLKGAVHAKILENKVIFNCKNLRPVPVLGMNPQKFSLHPYQVILGKNDTFRLPPPREARGSERPTLLHSPTNRSFPTVQQRKNYWYVCGSGAGGEIGESGVRFSSSLSAGKDKNITPSTINGAARKVKIFAGSCLCRKWHLIFTKYVNFNISSLRVHSPFKSFTLFP
jgi:hypothetical protein